MDNKSLFFRLSLLSMFSAVLSACGGGGGGGSASATPPVTLSADQQIYENLELKGGSFNISSNFPYGGGNLVPNSNFIFATSTGNLQISPAYGPQLETPYTNTMDAALPVPGVAPTYYFLNGQILSRLNTAQRQISYVNGGVRVDYLSDNGQIVQSNQFSNFSQVSLSGMIDNTPAELQAQYPFDNWVTGNNFAANAQWLPGSFYTKRQGQAIADYYVVLNCDGTTPITSPAPCSATSLSTLFPHTLYNNNSTTHPDEIDLAANGTISTVQGVSMWISNAPLNSKTQVRRIFFQMNGQVYLGEVHKAGAPYVYGQTDGSVVNYTIGLNQTAIQSIQQGLITGASVAGSQAGTLENLTDVDMFGIGGTGPNGALAPADLTAHYNIPPNLNGAGQTIAIIDGPSTGNVGDDLTTFSQAYQLPACTSSNGCFQQVTYPAGATPSTSVDWGSEPELDTQMVHAIAPQAHIILVTAATGSFADLMSAANQAAAMPDVTAVSMSFGSPNNILYMSSAAQVNTQDTQFANAQAKGMIFFASTGDGGGNLLGYPAASPYVTAVGGTRINTIPWTSSQSETAWQFTGGGASSYGIMPTWQSALLSTNSVLGMNGNMRATPDVAAVADFQNSAVGVYYKQRWVMTGGTSVASPIWAGISAVFAQYLANKGSSLPALVKSTSGGFNGLLYQTYKQHASAGFYDIITGSNNVISNGPLNLAGPGFDDVSGLGAPNVSQLLANF